MKWLVVATWSTPIKGVREAVKILSQADGSALDAAEIVARMEEDDPENSTVGFGGFPNRQGEVELDAAFMDGRDLSIGAVAAVKGYRNPVSIARRLLAEPAQTFLVGRGAEDFAADKGFLRGIVMTDAIRQAWEKRELTERSTGHQQPAGHDTIGVVTLDQSGDMAVATSTSGMAMKHRGRLGDTALVGSGFYVDNDIGGAAATGVGEDIMKGCTCFVAVELIRQGMTPQEAAETAVRRTHEKLARHIKKVGNIALVCADNKGHYGGAANHPDFSFAVATDGLEPVVVAVTPCC